MLNKSNLILPLSSISNNDKELVGEKAANLGEMKKQGFPLPEGFVITQNAYRQFALKHNLPDKLIKEIFKAYKRLEESLKDATVELFFRKKEVTVAYGEAVLLEKIKSIWAHNFTSIVVRKIPQTSYFGVMFTIDPTHNDKTKIVIKEGKTENRYEVLKKGLKITSKIINKGKVQMLTDKQLINVAEWGKKIQDYYYFPQEVYFAIDKNKIFITRTKPITIQVQSSKLKAQNHTTSHVSKPRTVLVRGKLLLVGTPASPGIATGHLRIIQNMQDVNKILRGEVVVIPYQDLIIRPVIKAGAIVVTDNSFHHMPPFTPSARFSGKPALITTPNEAKMLKNGAVVTVNGKNGKVYLGSNF